MDKFIRLTATACPLDVANLNTDQLLPARFLKVPLAPVGIEAQIVQQHRCEPGRTRHLQKACREELIGVEIGDVERAGGRSQPDEFVHARLTLSVRRAAAARRLAFRSLPLPRPWPETSNGCARPVPAARGNCGWWWRRSVRLAPPHRR